MILIGNQWYYTVEESQEILRSIFPNYPDSLPCHKVSQDLYPPDSPTCKFKKENRA